MLQIKHIPNNSSQLNNKCACVVGDFVRIRSHNNGKATMEHTVSVVNMRTGLGGSIFWAAVFPVGIGDLCECIVGEATDKSTCRCEYVDYGESMVSSS